MNRLLRHRSSGALLHAGVWLFAMLLALALPVAGFIMKLQFVRGTLASEAHARAFILERHAAASPSTWLQDASLLREHLGHNLVADDEHVTLEHDHDRRTLIDATGRVVLQIGPEQPRPTLRHRQPMHQAGGTVGWIEVEHSLRGPLEQALVFAALSLLLGAGSVILLTRLPLKRLRSVEDELARRAFHDDLTGLYNREALRRLLAEAVAVARRDRRGLSVLFIDLDRFKGINDSMGHAAGDEALRAVAARLRQSVRERDIVARVSGDEFVIVIDAPRADAECLADKLQRRFDEAFSIGGRDWHLGCSVGVSAYPEHGDDPDRLLACADIAMLQAKASGRSASRLYQAAMDAGLAQEAQIREDLRGALERHEFLLHYQPLIDLRSGRATGCEALLRWQHPQRGLVAPAQFIPILEESGQIHVVGRWVMAEACRQMRLWCDRGMLIRQVAVNVSPRQFARERAFVESVREVLAATGLPAQCLQLEVTEGTLMSNSQQCKAVLAELRGLGVELAIDDFGSGYSSLAYLSRFPVSVLKVDRSFVREMLTDAHNAAIVKAVIQMADGLKLSVTAEGIETDEQARALIELGCNTGQGFGFAQPMPADAFEAWISGTQVAAISAAQPA